MMPYKSPSSIIVSTKINNVYRPMASNLNDRIFLLGHADTEVGINHIFQVQDMRNAITFLGGPFSDSPLLTALLQCYYAGARNIWIMPVAPMSEYESDLTLRDAAYYQTYYNRLQAAYDILKEWDIPQITIPIDAPFNSTIDFLTQLVEYCAVATKTSGEIHNGMIGTRGSVNNAVDAMKNDARLSAYGVSGKYVSVFAGDAVFRFPENSQIRTASVVPAIAGLISSLNYDSSSMKKVIPGAVRTTDIDWTEQQVKELAEAGVNTVGPHRSRRTVIDPYKVVVNTDNTLAPDTSPYYAIPQVRLASFVSKEIRSMGKRFMGTIGFDQFRLEVSRFMASLVHRGIIREYDLDINRAPGELHKVLVDVNLKPYLTIREIYVTIEVGPEQGRSA